MLVLAAQVWILGQLPFQRHGITSALLLSICMWVIWEDRIQGGQGRDRDEALTKRCKYEDFIDLKVSLRVDRATSVIDFGRLMLGIMLVSFDFLLPITF